MPNGVSSAQLHPGHQEQAEVAQLGQGQAILRAGRLRCGGFAAIQPAEPVQCAAVSHGSPVLGGCRRVGGAALREAVVRGEASTEGAQADAALMPR